MKRSTEIVWLLPIILLCVTGCSREEPSGGSKETALIINTEHDGLVDEDKAADLLKSWGLDLGASMDVGPDTIRSRLDAAILRDDLDGFKALLSEYETIEALMADVHDSIKYWEVDDPFIQRGLTAEMFDQSPLNKAIFSQKLAFCEACLPLYSDINHGQPLLAALRTALPLEGEKISDPSSTRFGRIIGQFDTTNGGSSYDEKDELVKLQDALWKQLEEKGPSIEIIQWLLEQGADPDDNGALHMAMQNPSRVSDTIVQVLLDKGASPNLEAYQATQFHFLWESQFHSLSPLDVSLPEDEFESLDPLVARAYEDALSALAAAGGKHTNAYLAGAKGKEKVFHALTKTQGGANAIYKGRPMLQNAILGRDILLQQFLIRNGADLQYLEPETGKNYLELKWWVDRAQRKVLWREDPLNDPINTEILEALETAGLKVKDLYCAIASNDPVAFKPFMEDPEALRARNVLSSSRMLSHPGEDNDRLLREVQNYPEPRKNMGFNAMELALRLNAWHVFDILKELEPPFEILSGILVKEVVASRYDICLEDSFAHRKWKEVLDRGIRVSSLPFGTIDMLSSMTCDEAMKMIEALCGVKSDWTEGLTLEQSYLFKGDAMPEEGLLLEVYSNGQARLNGMHSPMQVARTQAEITLSAPSMDALVLQLDNSNGTFKIMQDGEIADKGTFTTGIGK